MLLNSFSNILLEYIDTYKYDNNSPALMTFDEYFRANGGNAKSKNDNMDYDFFDDHNEWKKIPKIDVGDIVAAAVNDNTIFILDKYEENSKVSKFVKKYSDVGKSVNYVNNVLTNLKNKHIRNTANKSAAKKVFTKNIKGISFDFYGYNGESMGIYGVAKYGIIAFDGDILVGYSYTNEVSDKNTWLQTGIMADYSGYGLGYIMSLYMRKKYPNIISGKVSMKAVNMLKKIHKKFVEDFLSNGVYSKLVREKKLSHGRVKEIIDSTK